MTMQRRAVLILTAALVAVAAACGGEEEPPQVMSLTVTDAGFATPESVHHDAAADLYLVSNINGAPTDEDGNGFISQVTPDGEVSALKWIDGMADGVTLNAPKGMAIIGDTLYVTDITHVRAFHRVTGEPLGSWAVEGATFLNDLAAADGTLYVSDSGLNPDFSSSGTDAVYRFEDGQPVVVAGGSALSGPNGLAVHSGQLVIVSFGAPHAWTVPAAGGDVTVLAELPGGSLDGVVILDDGSMLISSWETSAVYHVPAGGGEAVAVVEEVPSPADIGWDSERNRALIPVFQEDRLEFHHVDIEGGM